MHRIAATAVSLLTLVVVLWLIFKDPRPQAKRLGWLTLALALLQDSVGHAAVFALIPRTAGIAHALMAPLFFAAVVAIAVVTSPPWNRGPEHVLDYGWPSMRSLAILTPTLVLLQILLGAAFRQKALTLLPHVLGAMFVVLVILLESIFVLQQFPTHRALRAAAKTLLGVGFGQVFLGTDRAHHEIHGRRYRPGGDHHGCVARHGRRGNSGHHHRPVDPDPPQRPAAP